MKVSLRRTPLLEAVVLVERLVGKKESLPVLSCILIDVQKNVTLRATNLEAGIEVGVVGEVIAHGVVAVPANILSQTLRAITSENMTLSNDEGNLLIEAQGTRTLIKTVSSSEFPKLEPAADLQTIHIVREKLLLGLQGVVYAASPSMIRPELGSVFVKFSTTDPLICVATDSFRLAEKTISKATEGTGEVLIPLKHTQEIIHILEHLKDEYVDISVDDVQMVIKGGNVRFLSRVVDGQFPDYKTIIPKESTTEVTLLKNDLTDVLRKARVFSNKEQQVGFHIYPKRKIFTATAQSQEVGEMSDSIDAALTGEDLDINFHIGYVADCISHLTTDSIVMSFSGVGRPLIIRPVGDMSYTYLVMPLNR